MPQVRAESVQHSNVINLFTEHALRCPEAPCISFVERNLSYGELDGLADLVSRRLQAHGVGPSHLVAVYLERSPELIAAILGILRAGAGYLPIDPLVPENRLAYMLTDSAATTVITQSDLRSHVGEHPYLLISELTAPATE